MLTRIASNNLRLVNRRFSTQANENNGGGKLKLLLVTGALVGGG